VTLLLYRREGNPNATQKSRHTWWNMPGDISQDDEGLVHLHNRWPLSKEKIEKDPTLTQPILIAYAWHEDWSYHKLKQHHPDYYRSFTMLTRKRLRQQERARMIIDCRMNYNKERTGRQEKHTETVVRHRHPAYKREYKPWYQEKKSQQEIRNYKPTNICWHQWHKLNDKDEKKIIFQRHNVPSTKPNTLLRKTIKLAMCVDNMYEK